MPYCDFQLNAELQDSTLSRPRERFIMKLPCKAAIEDGFAGHAVLCGHCHRHCRISQGNHLSGAAQNQFTFLLYKSQPVQLSNVSSSDLKLEIWRMFLIDP